MRTSIFNADKAKSYHCPCCGTELIQKRGKIVIHHFAHKTLDDCVSYYDNKGPWHRYMQSLFPEEQREIYNSEFGKHFFDVLTSKNTIVEFQHSSISYDLFDARTNAYVNFSQAHNTRKPIWVFNFCHRDFLIYHGEREKEDRFRKIRWYRPTKIFDNYTSKDDYELWFMIAPLKYKPDYEAVFNGYEEIEVPQDIKRIPRHQPSYIKVSGIYGNKIVYGLQYSERDFEDYIKQV